MCMHCLTGARVVETAFRKLAIARGCEHLHPGFRNRDRMIVVGLVLDVAGHIECNFAIVELDLIRSTFPDSFVWAEARQKKVDPRVLGQRRIAASRVENGVITLFKFGLAGLLRLLGKTCAVVTQGSVLFYHLAQIHIRETWPAAESFGGPVEEETR